MHIICRIDAAQQPPAIFIKLFLVIQIDKSDLDSWSSSKLGCLCYQLCMGTWVYVRLSRLFDDSRLIWLLTCLSIGHITLFHWTNNTSYSNEYLDTHSPAFTSSSARSTAIWGNFYLVYLIGGMEIFVSICSF